MRLGFSVRVLGVPDLPACDPRPDAGSVSTSLAYLRDILLYLRANQIRFYRMHTALVPLPLSTDVVTLEAELQHAHALAADVARLAAEDGVRLTFHPYSAVVLNAPQDEQYILALSRLAALVTWLDGLELGPEAVVVLHVGGVYDDPVASLERFVRRYEALPPAVRRRVVLENDDRRYDWADAWRAHNRCGVPLVLDVLHHQVLNRQRIPLRDALAAALTTWPAGVTPKLHFSTPRTDVRSLEGSGRLKVPTWSEHADFCNPFAFIDLLVQLDGLPDADLMLETKARDVALLKLREDVARFAPERRTSLL